MNASDETSTSIYFSLPLFLHWCPYQHLTDFYLFYYVVFKFQTNNLTTSTEHNLHAVPPNFCGTWEYYLQINYALIANLPIPVAERSKAWDCGRSLSRIVVSNPVGAWISVCCECCVLSGRSLCDELITRPEEFYRLWWVWVIVKLRQWRGLGPLGAFAS